MVPPWVKLAWLLLAAGASCSGDGVGAILRPPPTTWGQTPVFCTLRPLCVKLWGPTVCRTPNCRVLPALAWRVCSGHSSNTSGPLSAEAILFIKRHNFSLIALEKNTMINLPPVADDAEKKIAMESLATLRSWYAEHADEAKQLVDVGASTPKAVDPVELAAWTMLANQLMNLDEFLCK